MLVNKLYVERTFDLLHDFVLSLDSLNTEEHRAIAEKLQEIYSRTPHQKHKEWMQKLHELLDIN